MALGNGLDKVPLRIPAKWDATWFESFVRDVLALADIRNADTGDGITITGASNEQATISATADVEAIADAAFILASGADPALPNSRELQVENGVLAIETSAGVIRIVLLDGGVFGNKIRPSVALSVMGNPSNATAVAGVTDIVAGGNDQVLRRVADALGFGGLTLDMAADALWTFAKLQTIANGSILGRRSAGPGLIEEITASELLDLIGNTTGAILYRSSGGGWVLLPPAANGDVLTLAAGIPAWVTPTVGPVLASGTYTPVATIVGSSTSTAVPAQAQYLRVGNTVTVSGVLAIGSTIASNVEVTLTLPVASNFGSQEDAAGSGVSVSADMAFRVVADATANEAAFKSQTVGAGISGDVAYTYTYQVIP